MQIFLCRQNRFLAFTAGKSERNENSLSERSTFGNFLLGLSKAALRAILSPYALRPQRHRVLLSTAEIASPNAGFFAGVFCFLTFVRISRTMFHYQKQSYRLLQKRIRIFIEILVEISVYQCYNQAEKRKRTVSLENAFVFDWRNSVCSIWTRCKRRLPRRG